MNALDQLTTLLRDDGSVISPHVRDPDEQPVLGDLAAAGPRAQADPAAYALIVEAVREGYLLHYAEPRIVAAGDPDLALLAGDYLYATGLARLARLGDLEAVTELSDLISLTAHLHGDAGAPAEETTAAALWLAAAVAVGGGTSDGHTEAKRAVREGDPSAANMLLVAAESISTGDGLADRLAEAREAIGFASTGSTS